MAESTETLISLVEKFPCLWDMRSKEYHNRDLKDLAWKQVLKDLFVEWDILDEEEQKKKAAEVKKKWANTRDNYKKDLNKIKNVPSGSASQPTKRYIYADCLSFLDPVLESRSHESNFENPVDTATESQTESTAQSQVETTAQSERTTPLPKRKKNNNVPNQILEILKNKNKKDKENESVVEDDDTKFLLSLRSDLKVMNRSQKLKFKIGMLELINKITQHAEYASSVSPHASYSGYQSQSLYQSQSSLSTTPSPNHIYSPVHSPSPSHSYSPQVLYVSSPTNINESNTSTIVKTVGNAPVYLSFPPSASSNTEVPTLSIPDSETSLHELIQFNANK